MIVLAILLSLMLHHHVIQLGQHLLILGQEFTQRAKLQPQRISALDGLHSCIVFSSKLSIIVQEHTHLLGHRFTLQLVQFSFTHQIQVLFFVAVVESMHTHIVQVVILVVNVLVGLVLFVIVVLVVVVIILVRVVIVVILVYTVLLTRRFLAAPA